MFHKFSEALLADRNIQKVDFERNIKTKSITWSGRSFGVDDATTINAHLSVCTNIIFHYNNHQYCFSSATKR